jgi:hypothetical protein
MTLQLISKCLIAAASAVFLTGCLMRETVTSGGEVEQDNYVIKRPLKDAIERSE